jgi:molybdopterin-biosynthesis enzyme MoeA-like protein
VKSCEQISSVGLIVIGNEILDGRRIDRHFGNALSILAQHNLEMAYCLTLPDNPCIIESQLRWAFSKDEPFFCCGGIGSTPDDHTRSCAARASGRELQPHPLGIRIVRERFGEDATPARLRMVEFPEGSELVPNPVNQVPGFSIVNGYVIPGFPQMAEPMMKWVLENSLDLSPPPKQHHVVSVKNAREADLVEVMEGFTSRFPGLRFSSLPRFTRTGTEVELEISGTGPDFEAGVKDIDSRLNEAGFHFNTAAGQ